MGQRNPVKTVTKTIMLEAQQFFASEDIPPRVMKVEDYDPISRTKGFAYFIETSPYDLNRLGEGDWVVWDPMSPDYYPRLYTNEQFLAQFKEVGS